MHEESSIRELSEKKSPVVFKALYIWPEGADTADLKSAVLEAQLAFTVRPFWFHPEHNGRAIALADGFPYINDYAYPKSQKARVAAVRWALGLQELDRGPSLVLDQLRAVLGDEVRELEEWEL